MVANDVCDASTVRCRIRSEPDFRWGAFIAALIGSIFIQIGTNLANDYSDAKRGADTADRLGPVRVTSAGLVAPRRVLYATWLAFGVAVVAGIYLATVAGWVIIAVGAASIAAGVLYTGGPRPYGYAGHGRAVRVPVLRPGRRQRLLLRAARAARLAAVLALGLGRAARRPRSWSSTTSATSRPTAAPASARSPCGSAASAPGRCTRRCVGGGLRASSCIGPRRRRAAAWRCIGAARRAAGRRPLQAVLTRTDGPSLNGALADTGALLGRVQRPGLGSAC